MKELIRIRQLHPKKFEKDKFRTHKLNEGVSAVIGITKEGKSQVQSFTFDKATFTLPLAKSWVKDYNLKLRETAYDSVKVLEESVIGATTLSPAMNNDKESIVPDDIATLFPDIKFSNGKVNREKIAETLNDIKKMQKFISTSDFAKLKKLLLAALKESFTEVLIDNGFNLLEGESSFTADDFDIVPFDINLEESFRDTTVKKARVRIIKSGESKNGNVYSGKCLREATQLFDGLPIYPNHSDEKRKVQEKVGFYSNPIYIGDDNDGEIQAIANILESEKKIWDLVKEQYNYPNAKLCGFSINAFGTGRIIKESGKTIRYVETIARADSTDIVDNPSAGGKVMELLESIKTEYTNNIPLGEETMDEITLREKHSDLVKKIEESAKALALREAEDALKKKCASCEKEYSGTEESKSCPECVKAEEAKVKESVETLENEKNDLLVKLTESSEKIKTLEKDVYISKLKESIEGKLSNVKYKAIPVAMKTRLVESLIELGEEKREGEKPSNWDLKITEETDYVNKCRGPKDQLVLGSETTDNKSTETEVKLTEQEKRSLAKSVSKVI